ncbi:MAG: hypothetical protein U5Q16_04840 [Gammaproteobacteria bacterium]|nr:hypothetical protein [Gammaproteobacteria bacterium]
MNGADGTSASGRAEIEQMSAWCGAGPAGLALASDLARSGVRVVVAERGGSTPAQPKTPVEVARGLPYPLDETIGRGVGGTAGLWGVETPDGNDRVRFRQLDRVRSTDARASAWRHGRLSSLNSLAGIPKPVAPSDYQHRRRTSPTTRSSAITGGNVVPAVFEFPSKDTFTRSLPELLAASDRVELLFDHHVTEIVGRGDPLEVRRVVLRPTGGGAPITVLPRWLVVAGGAVENVALLGQLGEAEAGRRRMPEALGRGFMEHFHFNGGLLVPSSANHAPADRQSRGSSERLTVRSSVATPCPRAREPAPPAPQ